MADDLPDIFGVLDRLCDALSDPHLDEFLSPIPPSRAAKRAALRVAIALGYCRLFGFNPPEADGVMPIPMAIGAAEAMVPFLDRCIANVIAYPEEWDDSLGEEAEDLTIGILEQRMDAWAANTAIAEAALDGMVAEVEDPRLPELLAAQKRYEKRLHELDAWMCCQEVLELLSTATDLYTLDNWRAMLVEPYSLHLPYWLDGTLEEIAKQIQEEFEAEDWDF